jgi:riboflavin kinase/FMN adenylyltransferase
VRFESHQIVGRGRARTLGFPTINLEIPKDLNVEYGIYGAYLIIDGVKYLGALHYGASPTFDDDYKSCEIYLIDLKDKEIPETKGKKLEVDILKRIREVKKFANTEDLIKQIDQDIKDIRLLP